MLGLRCWCRWSLKSKSFPALLNPRKRLANPIEPPSILVSGFFLHGATAVCARLVAPSCRSLRDHSALGGRLANARDRFLRCASRIVSVRVLPNRPAIRIRVDPSWHRQSRRPCRSTKRLASGEPYVANPSPIRNPSRDRHRHHDRRHQCCRSPGHTWASQNCRGLISHTCPIRSDPHVRRNRCLRCRQSLPNQIGRDP